MNDPTPVLLAAAQGDDIAWAALEDMLEEGAPDVQSPFEVGRSYLICLNTLYYVGRVTEVRLGWVRMESASWAHWTGRLSTLLARQSFSHKGWPSGDQKPRTEFVGEAILFVGTNGSSAYPWTGDLPAESIG